MLWFIAAANAQKFKNAGAYFALGLAAEEAGRSAQAREQFAAAEKFWSKADKNLPELRRIQEAVSAQP